MNYNITKKMGKKSFYGDMKYRCCRNECERDSCSYCSDGNRSFGLSFFNGAFILETKSNSYNKMNYLMSIVRI